MSPVNLVYADRFDPAKTLDQMLYKRVAKGKTFYKTADGRFGLLEFRSTTEEMRLPNTAA